MTDTVVIALIGGISPIVAAIIAYRAVIKAARITSKENKVNSQAGDVGEEGVRN
jgi:hypothetical protein